MLELQEATTCLKSYNNSYRMDELEHLHRQTETDRNSMALALGGTGGHGEDIVGEITVRFGNSWIVFSNNYKKRRGLLGRTTVNI